MESTPDPKIDQAAAPKTEWRSVLASLAPAFLLGLAIMAVGYVIWDAKGLDPDSEVPSLFGLAMVFVLQRWTYRLWRSDRQRFWRVLTLSIMLDLLLVALRVGNVIGPRV
jgi:hypothetical protein